MFNLVLNKPLLPLILYEKYKTLWLLLMDGVNYLKATEPLRGESLSFTIQSPGVPGILLINFSGTKG